jgi:uncharacterized protein YtpQ (UPF0354 family)
MTISGHVPAPDPAEGGGRAHSEAPEHDWNAASMHVFPALRPLGTQGIRLAEVDPVQLASEGTKKHALALLDTGPADLVIAYVLRAPSFDVVINADHLLTWAITADALRDTAMANLRGWSATAPWTDELSDGRHLLSSDTGDGGDAARILLPEVRAHIAGACGGPARTLVALPDRDLLIAGSLNPGDGSFAAQLGSFVLDVFDGAHEPIDRRLFELVGDEHELVAFAG